ncbi:hypothetical protein AGMMS49975_13760 [Clostridia bacterium]|nr:hypothetical protein AGMMS49975_13760 [Clostridia bacterium]
MDENWEKATEDFVMERVNYHGVHENEETADAYMALKTAYQEMEKALKGTEYEQLLRDCENAYHLADGKSTRFYYNAGLNDGIRALTQR